MRHYVAVFAVCLAVWWGHKRHVHAQPAPADRALATDLFQRGRRLLLEQRDYASACPMLQESQRLDPACGTLLNLALCHAGLGRTATAWAEFNDALAWARRDQRADRIDFSTQQIAALERKLSRLVVQIPAAADVPGLEVERDDTALARSVWGAPMPVDPGEHVIRAHAAGYEPFEAHVSVGAEGDQRVVEIGPLVRIPEPAPAPAAPASVAAPEPERAPVLPPKARAPLSPAVTSPRRGRALAWTLAALGGASLIASTVTGVYAFHVRDEAVEHCHGGRCSERAYTLNARARRLADASTGLAIATGVCGLGAVYLWWRADKPQAVRAELGVGYRAAF